MEKLFERQPEAAGGHTETKRAEEVTKSGRQPDSVEGCAEAGKATRADIMRKNWLVQIEEDRFIRGYDKPAKWRHDGRHEEKAQNPSHPRKQGGKD